MDPLFAYFLICGTAGLIMWYKMLRILVSNGQEVNYFISNPKYFFDFNKLIKKETDKQKRVRYYLLLWGQILLIPLYLIGGIYLM